MPDILIRTSFSLILLSLINISTSSSPLAADSVQANIYYKSASIKMKEGQYQMAKDLFIKAAAIYKELELHEEWVKCRVKMSFNNISLAKYEDARAIINETIPYALKWLGEANLWSSGCYKVLGQIENHEGKYEIAAMQFNKALRMAKKIKDVKRGHVGGLYNDLGIVNWRLNRLEESLNHFTQALTFIEPHERALIRGNIAVLYTEMGNFDEAIKILQQVLDDDKKRLGNEHPFLGIYYNNIAECYREIRDFKKASQYYVYTIQLYEKGIALDHPVVADAYNGLGLISTILKDYHTGKMYFDSAYKTWRTSYPENHPNFISYYENVGSILVFQKQYSQGLTYFNKALDLAQRSSSHELIVNNMKNVGIVNFHMKHYDEAYINLSKALKLAKTELKDRRRILSDCYVELARLAYETGDYDNAMTNLNYGINALIPGFITTNIYKVPSRDQIQADYSLFEIFRTKVKYQRRLWEKNKDQAALSSCIRIYELMSDLSDKLRKLYETEESNLRLSVDVGNVFEEALELTYDLYKTTNNPVYLQKAFYFAEKNQAAILRQSIFAQSAMKYAGIPDNLIQQETIVKSLIEYYKKSIADDSSVYMRNKLFLLNTKHDSIMTVIRIKYPSFYELKYKDTVPTLAQAQNQLDNQTAIIKFFFGDNALYTFLITNKRTEIYQNKDPKEIHTLVDHMLKGIRDKKFDLYTNSAYRLYGNLLGFLKIPPQVKKLVFVPDGELHYVPFDALVTSRPSEEATNFKSLHYLLQDYAVQYYASVTLLSERDHIYKKSEKPFIAFAPVSVNSSFQLPELIYTEQEATYVSNQMNGELLLKEKATESAFSTSAGKYSILHLSTHAIINDHEPLYSKLLFFPSKDTLNDDIVYSYELYNLKLNAELVTLSACNTGVGKLEKGEGMMSLARAFMYAGTSSILMSLWPASDKSTERIMKFFYDELDKGKSKDEALRQAKLNYLQHSDEISADPFLWSSFILIGDARPLSTFEDVSPKIWVSILIIVIILAVIYFLKKKGIGKISRHFKVIR